MAEADAAFGLMKEKNVVGPLYRTKELIRALKGLDPVTVPEKEARPTLQFFKQLKFLTEECEDKSEEGVKVSFDFGEIRGEFGNLLYIRGIAVTDFGFFFLSSSKYREDLPWFLFGFSHLSDDYKM